MASKGKYPGWKKGKKLNPALTNLMRGKIAPTSQNAEAIAFLLACEMVNETAIKKTGKPLFNISKPNESVEIKEIESLKTLQHETNILTPKLVNKKKNTKLDDEIVPEVQKVLSEIQEAKRKSYHIQKIVGGNNNE